MENETLETKEKGTQSEKRPTSAESKVSKGKTNRAFKKDEITEENESDISKSSADSNSNSSISIQNVKMETDNQSNNNRINKEEVEEMNKKDYQAVPLDEQKNSKEKFVIGESKDEEGKSNPLKVLKKKLIKQKDNKKKDQSKDEDDVSFIQLFKFADWIDKLLILIGSLSALIAAGLYPLMFLVYGQVANTFVDFEKYKKKVQLNGTLLSTPSAMESSTAPPNVTNICFQYTSGSNDFDGRMSESVKLYVLIGFISLLLYYLANVCLNTAAERQIKRMRNVLYKSIVRQDIAFFDKNTAGELSSVITGNIENLKYGINFKLSDFITLLGRGVGCLIFAFISAWKFSIVFMALLPFMILATAIMVGMIKKYSIKEFQAYGTAGRIAQEVLSSIRTVISFGLEKKYISKYEENLKDAESMALKKGLLSGIFGGISTGLFNTCFAIGIYYGSYLVRTDCETYPAGSIVKSFFSLITATFSLGQALPFLKELAEVRGAAKKVFSIINTNSAIDVYKQSGKRLDNLKGSIRFENVFFNYPQRPDAKILKGLSLSIPAGRTVALVGSSGGGKSTVVSLLQRFYLPNSGKIYIDDFDITELDLNWLRSQTSLVSQEPVLFSSTIRENIRLGRLDATDAEIEEAAKQANAHNFILDCAKKYDTLCGERGTQLSGGQKQRIAIARALIRNPKILLLDEATSALDYQSEKTVQEALDKAKVGRTTIIIAHRLSTIRNADLIVAMADGQVKETGTHDELMNLKGFYYELVISQTKKSDKEEIQKEIEDENAKDMSAEKILTDESSSESEIGEDEAEKKRYTHRQTNVSLKAETKTKKKKLRLNKLFRYEKKLLKLQKPEILWLIAGSIGQMINGAIFPAIALIFSEIYTIFASPDESEQKRLSLQYMGIIFGFAFINLIASFVYNYAFALSGARLTKTLRIKMFESMLRQEISFHDAEENRSGILNTQLSTAAPFCKGLTSDKIGLLSQAVAGLGFAIIASFIYSWKMTLIMLIFVPINFFSGVITSRASTNIKVNGKYSEDEGGRMATETIENIKTVISLGREEYFIDEFAKNFNRKFKKQLLILHVQAFFYSITNSLLFFIQCSGFSIGYYLMKYDNFPVSYIFKIYASLTFSSMILGRVYALLPDQKKASNSAKTAFKIIDRKSQIDSLSEEGSKPSQVIGDIEFVDVAFSYPNMPQRKILRNFNLKVKSGHTNALVGPSGSGKSTVCSLLLRFYDIEKGKITLDGVDIRSLNIRWLRSKIGIVSQEPVLFNSTVRENIANGDISRNDIPMGEIVDVAIQSNIHSRIESLPERYETIVGSKGSQMSGGEKQRIAIARALIRKPRILLLDEATSALDAQSEQVVQDALDKAQIGRTSIVIAHRLTTIQNSDKITVVKDGSVIEEGTHESLLKDKQFYYKLQRRSH